MPIPPGTKFHGVAPGVDTENKGSKTKNSLRQAYTIEEMGGGGGGVFDSDILYNLTDGFTFGRLTGSGTYAVGAEGTSVVDFIRDVLIMESSTFSASPVPQWLYNLTDIDVDVNGEYDGGTSATLVRRVNGGDIETLQENIAPGTFNFLDTTLPTFPEFANNYIQYYLNVYDAEGLQVLQDVAVVTQQPYLVPSVTTVVTADNTGRSPDEGALVREWGNDDSSIVGTSTKNSTYVPMTAQRIYRDATAIFTGTITGDPASESNTINGDTPTSPQTDFTYTTQVDDTKSDNDGNAYANVSAEQTVSMRPPMLFIANAEDGSGATPGQTLYNAYATSADGYFKLFAGEFAETFSTVASMADVANYAWVMYEDSLGNPEFRQGGPTGPIVNFTSFGTEVITNDFGQNITMRLYRSPFTGPFSTGTNFYISSNG